MIGIGIGVRGGIRRWAPADLAAYLTRASAAWYFDPSSGNLTQAAANVARLVTSPAGVLSILREPQSTNYIQNNSMAGLVTGTPGTLPTRWTGDTTENGISRQIVGSGTEYGMPYIDLRLSGTASVSASLEFYEEAGNVVAATQGSVWTHSLHMRVLSGTVPNTGGQGFLVRIIERSAAVAYLTEGAQTYTNLPSTLTEYTFTRTTTNASIAYVQPGFYFAIGGGTTCDFTVRVYAPRLEPLPGPTTPIITTNAGTVTRSRDEITIPTTVAVGAPFSQMIDFALPWQAAGTSRLTGGNSAGMDVSNTLAARVWNGVASVVTANLYTLGSRGKMAYAGNGAGRSLCLNAGAVAGDAQTHGVITPVLLGQLSAGIDSQAPVLYIHEYRQSRQRWTRGQLQQMTA